MIFKYKKYLHQACLYLIKISQFQHFSFSIAVNKAVL